MNKQVSQPHGSVEAILSLTKISTKTETGDGWGMMSGAPNNIFWSPARFFPPQSISKTKIYNEFFWNGQIGSGKRLCIILKMKVVLRVDKFNVDYIWSLVCFISSILSLAILILLNKVIHTVLLYGSFSKRLVRYKLKLMMVFCKGPLSYSKYVVFEIFHRRFFRKSAHSGNILVFLIIFTTIFAIVLYFWPMQSAQKLFSHLFTHYGLKIRNYGENCDKNGQKHQNISTMARFSEKMSMKYFENHIFTIWEGSLACKTLSSVCSVPIV